MNFLGDILIFGLLFSESFEGLKVNYPQSKLSSSSLIQTVWDFYVRVTTPSDFKVPVRSTFPEYSVETFNVPPSALSSWPKVSVQNTIGSISAPILDFQTHIVPFSPEETK